MSRLTGAAVVFAALLAFLPGGEAAGAQQPPLSHWLSWNAATRTARLQLVAGYDSANNGFNFDGYSHGRMLVTVPRGWRMTIVCRNAGSRYHSCGVVRGAGPPQLAFRGSSVPDPVRGLPPGASASFAFKVSRAGVYRLACLVPGHELAREYDVLAVVRSGKPRVELLSRAPG